MRNGIFEGLRMMPAPWRRNRLIGLLAGASSCLCLVLMLGGCSDSNPTAPSGTPPSPTPTPPSPTPTPPPAGSSVYAGSWRFTIRLTAIDNECGHTDSDIGVLVGPISVTVDSNGSFSVPSPVDASGAIDSSGNVSLALAARSTTCIAGSGGGGCGTKNHCDGTSVQAGDVSKWVMERP